MVRGGLWRLAGGPLPGWRIRSVAFAFSQIRSFAFEYRIRAEQSAVGHARVVADGETQQVMFDLGRSRVMRVPADLIGQFEKFEELTIPRRPAARD